jgi:hypothetical protein
MLGSNSAIRCRGGLGSQPEVSAESIVRARKLLGSKTVHENVAAFGTGTLNIADTRIPGEPYLSTVWSNGPASGS